MIVDLIDNTAMSIHLVDTLQSTGTKHSYFYPFNVSSKKRVPSEAPAQRNARSGIKQRHVTLKDGSLQGFHRAIHCAVE